MHESRRLSSFTTWTLHRGAGVQDDQGVASVGTSKARRPGSLAEKLACAQACEANSTWDQSFSLVACGIQPPFSTLEYPIPTTL